MPSTRPLVLAPTAVEAPAADLIVVGTGIKFWSHMTLEALAVIESADKVFHSVSDVMTQKWLAELNPAAEALPGYLPDRNRRETYERWIEIVLASVRAGLRTCATFYGHPGMLVYFSREAIRRARAEGFRATMLPGISTEACMIADLLADPGPTGWQSYTAPVFLRRRPRFDTGTPLVLWQLRVATRPGPPEELDRGGLRALVTALLEHYAAAHEVVVYEASTNPAREPIVHRLPLGRLAEVRFRASATLYVPAVPG